jgi:hypothetical protein
MAQRDDRKPNSEQILTTRQGHSVTSNQSQRAVGSRGPATLENYHFLFFLRRNDWRYALRFCLFDNPVALITSPATPRLHLIDRDGDRQHYGCVSDKLAAVH